mgnify:CR=1 FL=1
MNKIPSFEINHLKLKKGVYVSRKDVVGGEVITTFDLRMKRPYKDAPMTTGSMHVLEHIIATYLRNDKMWSHRIIYFGPMGCRTGFYLLIRGDYTSTDIIPLLERAYDYASDFNGDIPGCTTIECGNCYDMDLPEAINDAADYYNLLIAPKKYNLEYPPITEAEKEKSRRKYEREKKQQLKLLKEMQQANEQNNLEEQDKEEIVEENDSQD